MKLGLAFALGGMVVASGCQIMGGVQGSGVRKIVTRKVEPFSRVEIIGSGELVLSVGKATDLKLEIDDNLESYISTEVQGDTLIIKNTRNISSRIGPKVTVGAANLNAVSISGSGDAVISGILSSRFAATISGSGDIELSGRSGRMEAAINGSGNVSAAQLQTQETDVSIQGSGSAEVNATSKLEVSISGSGDVAYLGSPKVQKRISGSGDVYPKR